MLALGLADCWARGMKPKLNVEMVVVTNSKTSAKKMKCYFKKKQANDTKAMEVGVRARPAGLTAYLDRFMKPKSWRG